MRHRLGEGGLHRPDDAELGRDYEIDLRPPALPREQQGLRPGLAGRHHQAAVSAHPRHRQLLRIDLGLGGNEQCGVGRVRDEIHEWQVVVIGDTLIESLRANPISRKDCVAETHTPGLGEQRGFVELREGENAPRDEDIAKRTVGGRE